MRKVFYVVTLAILVCANGCSSSSSGDGGGGGVTFLSQLAVSPDGVLTTEATSVTARTTLATAATSVVLEKVSTASSSTAEKVSDLATMYDDGDATTHADDISGDGVYSAAITLTEITAGPIYVRVNADSTYSDIKTIYAIDAMTDTEWTLYTQTAPATAKTYFDSNGADATVTYINANNISGLKKAGKSEGSSGTGVWYVTDNGILGGVMAYADEEVATDNTSYLGGRGDAHSRGSAKAKIFTSPLPLLEKFASPFSKATETVDTNAVTSKNAIYIGPYDWQFGDWVGYKAGWDKIKNSQCPKFSTTEVRNTTSANDGNVTPETFKNLSNYGIVFFWTHGDNWYSGLYSIWTDLFGDDATNANFINPFASDDSIPVILTGLKRSDSNKATYMIDLLLHRLAIAVDGTYAVTPAFITKYNGTFPKSIVYMAACRGGYNDKLASAFLGKGASAVVAYDDYVSLGFAYNHSNGIFKNADAADFSLLPLQSPAKSITDAFNGSVTAYGATDPILADKAEIKLFTTSGNPNANLNVAAINDGSFEKGTTSGWYGSGDYRVESYIGSVTPQAGSYMGVITTGLGTYGTSLTESILEQNLCVPANATTITYNYDFLSEEPLCWVGSSYDDTFTVQLLDSAGSAVATGSTETVNSSSWTYLGGDYFHGGDDASTPQTCTSESGTVYNDGTYHTGWKTGTIDVSGYKGNATPYTLRFKVYDEGDSAWDSAATLDSVQVNVE